MKLPNISFGNNPVIVAVLSVLVVISIIHVFNISYPISVTTRVASEMAVVGEGSVDVVPDTASVQAGIVVNEAATVEEVEAEINQINNAIVSSLQSLGIEEEDIKTTNYSINPSYRFDEGSEGISGYNGNATLTIKVRETERLPEVITSATEAGANQIYDTQYTVDDPSKYREEARNEAINDAKEQAKDLAGQLGIRLGKVVNIVESGGQTGGPIPLYNMQRDSAMESAPAPDLQPGSQKITSTVTLYFETR